MGLLARWHAWRAHRRAALMIEARWTVAIDDGAIVVTDASGQSRCVALTAVDLVLVETNDTGPWGIDLWWLLFDGDGDLATEWPGGATGEQAAINRLTALPRFDLPAMSRAMASTDNATFTLWLRGQEPVGSHPTTS